jgi:histidyl-tRNA synthetase
MLEEAPEIIDHLCPVCRDHFTKVLERLDEMDVLYNLNPRLVRGLDYYTRTTFEIFLQENEEEKKGGLDLAKSEEAEIKSGQLSLAGGGRYDGLAEILGGRGAPSIGFAGGVERVVALLKQLKIQVADPTEADIFIAQLGEEAKKKSLKLFEDTRKAGFKVRESFAKNSLAPQLDLANKLGVKYTLILGQKEIIDGTIIIRHMESGIQEIVPFSQVIEEVKKRFAMGNGIKVYKQDKLVKDEKWSREEGSDYFDKKEKDAPISSQSEFGESDNFNQPDNDEEILDDFEELGTKESKDETI